MKIAGRSSSSPKSFSTYMIFKVMGDQRQCVSPKQMSKGMTICMSHLDTNEVIIIKTDVGHYLSSLSCSTS